MDFKPGEILIYRDRVYKKSWRVIALYRHAEWAEYMVCYVIEAPPENEEDLHTLMNLPVFFLHSDGDGYSLTASPGPDTAM